MPETMALFSSTKNLIKETKKVEKLESLEVAEMVLVQCI